ncbi:MAG: hypothetical protein ABJA98_14065 [Acidobacteriota bacterium]
MARRRVFGIASGASGRSTVTSQAGTPSSHHPNTASSRPSPHHPTTPSSHHPILVVIPLLVIALCPSSARAQFTPRPIADPATGERYHIEAAAGFWFPTADISIASQSLGIIGSTIDFKKDLGLTDQRFPEVHLELRPATRHKFRLQYIPIKYDQTGVLTRNVVFNGQTYSIGRAITSTLDWKAYRIGYEYDFISRDRGFGGFILDFKYTDVTANLATVASPIVTEFTQAEAPIPAIGGIFRIYVVPNISITGEVTGFTLPEKAFKDTNGHYLDVNVYGTLNFTNYVGVQVGYRALDVGYLIKTDTGSFTLQGVFFGVVARY